MLQYIYKKAIIPKISFDSIVEWSSIAKCLKAATTLSDAGSGALMEPVAININAH